MKLIVIIGVLILLIGCSQDNEIDNAMKAEIYQDGYIEGHGLGFDEGYDAGRNSGYSDGLADRRLKLFYLSDDELNDSSLLKDWVGNFEINGSYYSYINPKFCLVTLWNFSTVYLVDRGHYYVMCGGDTIW